MPPEEVARAHQHAWGAEAALQAVLLPEALLQRMECAALGETLDGLDAAAVGLDGEDRAALHRATVQAHGAGATARRVTADVGAGQPEVLPDEVHEQRTGADLTGVLLAVDGDGDRVLAHDRAPWARSMARRTARLVRTRTMSRL